MSNLANKDEGWHWLINARDNHYFRNGTSLCGKWAILGSPKGGFGGKKDCKKCKQLLQEKS